MKTTAETLLREFVAASEHTKHFPLQTPSVTRKQCKFCSAVAFENASIAHNTPCIAVRAYIFLSLELKPRTRNRTLREILNDFVNNSEYESASYWVCRECGEHGEPREAIQHLSNCLVTEAKAAIESI